MINKEDFEFHKSIVNWMMDKGIAFTEAMIIVSFAEKSGKSIPEAYFEIQTDKGKMIENKFGEMKWISIKERLPDTYNYVIVFADNQGTNEPKPYSIAMWEGDKWHFINHNDLFPNYGACLDIGYNMDSDDVTHWMLLPAGPKD